MDYQLLEFSSYSHGAGRIMSCNEAKRRFTVEDQIAATAHVECRKDAAVIDEIPMAYKKSMLSCGRKVHL